ncbi:MAG: hypothetical protein EAZ41_06100 [Sphingobacteriia bacterium]|nr:MAG: hypothetical protein EAZ41_06100 [Sphingobacteriia bacterium]
MQQVMNYSVKLKFIARSTSLFITTLLTLLLGISSLQAQSNKALREISHRLGQGVNISFLEQYWMSPDILYQKKIDPLLESIATQGFKTVRLPVAFDHFMADSYAQLNDNILEKLHEIYKRCEYLNLNLVIVYHYGKLRNENRYSENDRIIRIWKQVMASMKLYSCSHLFYELYNEPTTDMDVWKSSASTLIRELRKEDKDRIFIIGGTNYNGINELLNMGRLAVDDGKILYTFHFYEPYIFTHQGVDWTPEKTFITGFPYPYSARKMPALYNATPDSQVAQDYERYPREANYEGLLKRLKWIKEEADRLNLPLICTETGVINLAPPKSKSAYLSDITRIMKDLDIPVMLWDFNDKFSITNDRNRVIKSLRSWLK